MVRGAVLKLSRRTQNRIALRLLRTPRRGLRALYLGRRRRHRGHALDLKLQLLLDLMKISGRRPLEELDPPHARIALAAMTEPFEVRRAEVASVHDIELGGIPARVYRGSPDARQVMLYLHGGGFVVGSVASYDRVCRYIAHHAQATVVSVDYRLCPEHPYPAAHDDVRAAYDAVVNGAINDLDPTRLMVAGDSAGGNLAAAVAHHARATGSPLGHQYLVYPSTDLAHDTDSYRELASGDYFLTKEILAWFGDHMHLTADDLRDPVMSPARAPELSGLCRVTMVTAGFDPLSDEGSRYVDLLRRAGVEVEHVHYESMVHGFINMAGVITEGRALLDDMADTLRRL